MEFVKQELNEKVPTPISLRYTWIGTCCNKYNGTFMYHGLVLVC